MNKYQLAEEPDVDVLDIDNSAVRDAQIARLNKCVRRDTDVCEQALEALTEARKTGRAIYLSWRDAARARATVGEISDALEEEWGRHRATTRSISGVYGSAYQGDEGFMNITKSGTVC